MTGKKTLESWKEIARYLNRDVRTCRRWERALSLPVHRKDPSSESQVYADRREIDAWMRESDRSGESRPSRSRILLPILFLLPVIAAALFIWIKRPGLPADFTIQGSKLVILDASGRKSWTYDTGQTSLLPEQDYRNHLHSDLTSGDEDHLQRMPLLVIEDLDSDQRPEVLFVPIFRNQQPSDTLLCFSARKKLLWTYKAGQQIRYGARDYPDDYRISGIGTKDLDGDGRHEVLVIARHVPLFPNPVALLDAEGSRLGEYWNSGEISAFAFADLDGDGRHEIVLGGKNEEWKTAVGIVLDAARIQGASPQSLIDYQAENLGTSMEKYYFQFPRNSVDGIGFFTNCVGSLRVYQNKTMVFTSINCAVSYTMDFSMRLRKIDFSRDFINAHRRFREKGTLARDLDQLRIEILDRGLRYFNGSGWTPSPTPVFSSHTRSRRPGP